MTCIQGCLDRHDVEDGRSFYYYLCRAEGAEWRLRCKKSVLSATVISVAALWQNFYFEKWWRRAEEVINLKLHPRPLPAKKSHAGGGIRSILLCVKFWEKRG